MRKRLLELYRKLETEYWARNTGYKTPDWWPADTPYEVMVGAILTQNTNWHNAEKAIANLKMEDCLSPEAILSMRNTRLETLIRPSGFYRQKAERLKLATGKWIEVHRMERKPQTMKLREEWLGVKGIGKETADSILLYAFNRPIFVVDAYTRLFCEHHELFEAREYDEYREFFESNLPRSVPLFKEYHALIVEWAKENRRKKA